MSARTALATAATALAVAILPGSALGFETGFDEPTYKASDESVRQRAFEWTVEANAGVVRIDVYWRNVSRGQPLDPGNPADPAYDFSSIDQAVRGATSNGLDVLLSFLSAPAYAEDPDRPADVDPGTWKPDPEAFGAFARAVASRYSGSFAGLPPVRYFEAWNEPNHPRDLNPQWDGKRPASPTIYARMLNAFYAGVKGVNPGNQVIAGSMAPVWRSREPGLRAHAPASLRA